MIGTKDWIPFWLLDRGVGVGSRSSVVVAGTSSGYLERLASLGHMQPLTSHGKDMIGGFRRR